MAGKVFEVEEVVRFAHCDPAGIVFFPQYLVMLNTLHERWFGEALGVPYQHYIGERRLGLPTVRLECDFVAVSWSWPSSVAPRSNWRWNTSATAANCARGSGRCSCARRWPRTSPIRCPTTCAKRCSTTCG